MSDAVIRMLETGIDDRFAPVTGDGWRTAVNVPTTSTGENAIDATVEGTDVTVPVDAAAGITLGGERGAVSISLPFADQAADATMQKPGVVSYDNGNGTTTVPVVQTDGVQINTIIDNEAAPTRYAYPLTVPVGGTLNQNEDGSIIGFNASGEVVFTVAAPWAKDSVGTEVPTRYEVENNVVTQVVEHDNSFVYPIVADPYVGSGVFYSKAWISYTSQGYVVNAIPTAEGRRLNAVNVLGVHLSQLKSKLGSQSGKVTATVREQFYCHVVGNIFEPGTYNMESWRPYKDWGLQLNLWNRCNP